MKNTVPVTLQCLPAHTTSRAQYGCGYELDYRIITGVHMPGHEPLLLLDQGQSKNAIPGARRTALLVPLDGAMSQRLYTFVQASYIHRRLGFDCQSFAQYLMDAISAPNEIRDLETDGTKVDTQRPLEVGRLYAVTRNKVVIHVFLAVSPRATLSVGGVNAGLCLIKASDLLCAYGGTGFTRITRYM